MITFFKFLAFCGVLSGQRVEWILSDVNPETSFCLLLKSNSKNSCLIFGLNRYEISFLFLSIILKLPNKKVALDFISIVFVF